MRSPAKKTQTKKTQTSKARSRMAAVQKREKAVVHRVSAALEGRPTNPSQTSPQESQEAARKFFEDLKGQTRSRRRRSLIKREIVNLMMTVYNTLYLNSEMLQTAPYIEEAKRQARAFGRCSFDPAAVIMRAVFRYDDAWTNEFAPDDSATRTNALKTCSSDLAVLRHLVQRNEPPGQTYTYLMETGFRACADAWRLQKREDAKKSRAQEATPKRQEHPKSRVVSASDFAAVQATAVELDLTRGQVCYLQMKDGDIERIIPLGAATEYLQRKRFLNFYHDFSRLIHSESSMTDTEG